MRIGDLTQRVVIESSSATSDSYGGRSLAWSTLATVWAHVKALSGAEALVSGGEKVQARIAYEVTIRYRSDVTTQMRLTWGSRTLWIESVHEAGSMLREWTVLTCVERA